MSKRRLSTALAALMLTVLAAGTTLGYAGEVAMSITVTGPSGTVKTGVNLTLRATVRDAQGKIIAGQPVKWTWVVRVAGGNQADAMAAAAPNGGDITAAAPGDIDKINDSTTTTNSNGVATTTVNLAHVPGTRVVRATADDVSGQVTLEVTAAGLPRTSTLASSAPVPAYPVLGTLLAVLALVGGVGLVLRGALVRR